MKQFSVVLPHRIDDPNMHWAVIGGSGGISDEQRTMFSLSFHVALPDWSFGKTPEQ